MHLLLYEPVVFLRILISVRGQGSRVSDQCQGSRVSDQCQGCAKIGLLGVLIQCFAGCIIWRPSAGTRVTIEKVTL